MYRTPPDTITTSFFYIYRSDGSPWWDDFQVPEEYTFCFPADLDGNGVDELYCYSDSSLHLVEFDLDGNKVDSVSLSWKGYHMIVVALSPGSRRRRQ